MTTSGLRKSAFRTCGGFLDPEVLVKLRPICQADFRRDAGLLAGATSQTSGAPSDTPERPSARAVAIRPVAARVPMKEQPSRFSEYLRSTLNAKLLGADELSAKCRVPGWAARHSAEEPI